MDPALIIASWFFLCKIVPSLAVGGTLLFGEQGFSPEAVITAGPSLVLFCVHGVRYRFTETGPAS